MKEKKTAWPLFCRQRKQILGSLFHSSFSFFHSHSLPHRLYTNSSFIPAFSNKGKEMKEKGERKARVGPISFFSLSLLTCNCIYHMCACVCYVFYSYMCVNLCKCVWFLTVVVVWFPWFSIKEKEWTVRIWIGVSIKLEIHQSTPTH